MSNGRTTSATGPISLDDEVRFLLRSSAYSPSTRSVVAVETHKSWVFMADDYVYKLKKPILFDSTDLRSLPARRANSEEEVRLNRRLAPDVYLGIVSLTCESDGSLRLNGDGHQVDWLVKMRRLPAGLMMDRKVLDHSLTVEDVQRVALTLARFYEQSAPALRDGVQYRELLRQEIGINRRDLVETTLNEDDLDAREAIDLQRDFLARQADLFDQRAREGHVVEGHGDLRPEHVCLEPDPAIIDCLEFNRTLRIVDPADELAFLALQCERLGAGWVGEILFKTYAQETGDAVPEGLVRFYTSYRAATWARLAAWRARDPHSAESAKWVSRRAGYLDLALRNARLIG